ncbi:hypothetical protein ACIA5D_27435 [Actinoplanes sp. NPDC051513]|uniref:hypothetical protein n=1 Tax=Actinoplanes sp. NPDC051513 TaxID=3363908 RepID=UPI0037A139A3
MAALDVPAAAALDVLDRLVDRSLAIAEMNGDGVRYRLLDSVRAYGRERSEAAEVASGAHAEWFGEAAARAAEGLRGGEQARHLAFVRAERADIDAALAWAKANDPTLALRMVNGFGWAWIFLGAGADAARRSRDALSAAGPGAPAADRIDALLFAAWFEASGGDLDRAFADVRAARDIAPLPRTLLFLAFLHSQQGRPAAALEALAEFLGGSGTGREATSGAPHEVPPGEHREVASGARRGATSGETRAEADAGRWEEGAGRLLEGWARTGLGDTAAARAACDEALRILTPLGDAWALSHAEALLGGLAQAEHRYADAVVHLTRAADAAHRLGFAAAEALHLANLGRAQQQNGAPLAALDTLDRSAATAETVGELRGAAFARTRRARVLRQLGRFDECRAELATARGFYEVAGGGDGDLLSAHLAASLDDDRHGLEHVLAAARDAGDHEVELLSLDALARLYDAAGDHGTASELRAAADALLPLAGHQVSREDREDRQDREGPSRANERAQPG